MSCHAQLEIYSESLKDALDNLEFVKVVLNSSICSKLEIIYMQTSGGKIRLSMNTTSCDH